MTSAVPTAAPAAVAIDGGDLTLGSGLLALIRPALTFLAPRIAEYQRRFNAMRQTEVNAARQRLSV